MVNKSYPLHWPENWPRTQRPMSSQFKTSLARALNNVQESIRKFGSDSDKKIENLVISSNVSLVDQNPKDSGVALYFSWDGISTCIAVDRYQKIEENLQAIHHCIEAERTKLRHGGLNLVRAAFRGYAALPPPGGRHWASVLNVREGESMEVIDAAYKKLAKEYHPDNGGDAGKMAEINQAMAAARKEKKDV